MLIVTSLADDVLPLIRTRADLHRWRDSNRHGALMHEAVDAIDKAIVASDVDAVEVHAVTQKALSSAVKVIARADDSSGIIGDACRRLLDLHPRTAAAAVTSPARLVEWMVTFQFDGEVDYFELDPVAYAPALGARGVTAYRARLREIRDRVGPEPDNRLERLGSLHRHEHRVLSWNDRRLAVLDRDPDAIIRTHAQDRGVARWFHDTAVALAEIERTDLATFWARDGVDVGPVHQSLECADLWCQLLANNRGDERALFAEVLAARRAVFDRWPTQTTAAHVRQAVVDAGEDWDAVDGHVMTALAARSPHGAVRFALTSLDDPRRAWQMAHDLALDSDQTWASLAAAYEAVDPVATIPVHTRLVEGDLTHTDARRYRTAALRLKRMRTLAASTRDAELIGNVDQLIADLRQAHRRRPRLQREFDRAHLP